MLPNIGFIPQSSMPCYCWPQGIGDCLHLFDLFVWSCASSIWVFFTHLVIKCQDEHPSLFSPNSFLVLPTNASPAPNLCSFLPQVYRPKKQPLSSNIPCTCDAGYSPDITAKYHGSSYDVCMIQRSQVSQLLRIHSPPTWELGIHKCYVLF